ncbi:MAG: hypothetical protein NZ585_05260 [Chloracidobacterium sp.]|nr:hypothetical protein [Chloracidobacterium sp.]MDW8216897.1 hypothetical protein [Acidobacteriota bacterium]
MEPIPSGGSRTWNCPFAPFESAAATTETTFTRPGPAKVWVEVLEMVDGALTTVAVSPPLELPVTAPKFELKPPPNGIFVGQETSVSPVETPPLLPVR